MTRGGDNYKVGRALFLPALVFPHCCNKLPQIVARNNTDLSSHSSMGQKSKTDLTGLTSRYRQSHVPCWNSGGESISSPFLASRSYLHPWLMVLFSPSSKPTSLGQVLLTPSSLLFSTSISLFYLCSNYSRPPRRIQDTLSILKSDDR